LYKNKKKRQFINLNIYKWHVKKCETKLKFYILNCYKK
jgi:hypothetical protein